MIVKGSSSAQKGESKELQLPSKSAVQLIRQINHSLGREELQKLTSLENTEDKSRGATPNTSRSKVGTPAADGSPGLRSFDADFPLGDQLETNTVVENECDNDFYHMLDTPNTPNSTRGAPLASPSDTSEKGAALTSPVSSTNCKLQATPLTETGVRKSGPQQ